MRVVHVGLETSSFRAGGLNRYLEDLVAAERADGVDAVAVVLGAREDEVRGVEVVTPGRGSQLRRAWRVDRAVRSLGPVDLADVHFAGTGFVAARMGSLRSVPKVVHFQGPWADESSLTGASRLNVGAKRAIERAVYRRASRVIVLSTSFAAMVVERYGVAPWAVEVITPGVDLDRFSLGDRATSRESIGVGEGGRIVLAVRRLVPRMGLEVLLGAWGQMERRDDDRLIVVGEGPSSAELASLARGLGVDDSVRFLGRLDDDMLTACYRAADLTVVPSVALEGFGLVVLESLACGTPVLGTDADGLAEALELTGQSVVAAGDSSALAAAMVVALDASGGQETARTCREVAERHGWAVVAAQHREVYESVATGDVPLRVVVLDHTAVLSGGELAIARAIGGLRGSASIHTILASDGPLRGRLESSGATVEVLELAETARTARRDTVHPTRLHPLAALATARYVVRLARRLRELRPDVVHTNSLKSALYGGAAARLAGVPCVWHVRDMIEAPYLPTSAVRLVRAAARLLPTVVVANSASTLRTLAVTGGRVVPSPLDPSIRPSVRGEEGDGVVRFAIVGRLAEWKGQRLAIEAFASAFPKGGALLRVVGAPMFGEEAYAESLPELAVSLGVADRVEFCGFVDDVAGVLGATDVVVHASVLPEPFGQVVIEAMGARCAVVVADAGGPADLVTDGVDGLVYAMGDRAALAGAMRALAADPSLRGRLGDAGVITAASFTPAALAPLLLEAWNEASATTRTRPGRPKRRA